MRGTLNPAAAPWQARCLLGLMLLSLVFTIPGGTPVASAAGSLEATYQVSSTSGQSEVPQVANNNARLGIIWGERSDNSIAISTGGINASPTFLGKLNTGTKSAYQWSDIAVGSDGTLYIAYASGNSVFFRKRPTNGGWSGAVKVASDNFPNPVRIALAPNGTLWVVWRDADGTRVSFRFSDNGGAGWSGGNAGGTVASEPGNMFAPDIAVGPDNVPHVVWYLRSGGSNRGEARYADWNGSRFTAHNLTNDGSSLADQDPVIFIGGNGVQHIAWRKASGNSGWIIEYASRSPGGNWSSPKALFTTDGDAKYSPEIGGDDQGSVYVTFSRPNGSSFRQIAMVAKPAGSNWDSVKNVSGGRWDYHGAVTGSSSSGLKAHVVYQHEQGADDGEIYYKRYSYGNAVSVAGDPTVNNGAATFNGESVSVTFANVSGNPNQVRWRWGAEPSDAASDSNGWQTYANPLTVPRPSTLTSQSCTNLTLFVQLRNGSTLQTPSKSDDIIFDGSVQASIEVLNPHLDGKLSTFSQGASAGDTNNTRENFYNVRLTDTGDCAGLRGYGFNSGAETSWPTNTDTVLRQNNFAAGTLPGSRPPLTTYIIDNTGNRTEQTNTIIYDPRNGNDGQSANSGAPQVITGTFTISPSNSLLQKLDFSNVQVNDAVYGAAANLPTGSQYWGVWVATSEGLNPLDPSEYNSETLQWTPIRVNLRGTTFSVTYPLLSGRSGGDPASHAGTYWVYVKFLDGAGNPSVETLTPQKVVLTEGYSLIKSVLPITGR